MRSTPPRSRSRTAFEGPNKHEQTRRRALLQLPKWFHDNSEKGLPVGTAYWKPDADLRPLPKPEPYRNVETTSIVDHISNRTLSTLPMENRPCNRDGSDDLEHTFVERVRQIGPNQRLTSLKKSRPICHMPLLEDPTRITRSFLMRRTDHPLQGKFLGSGFRFVPGIAQFHPSSFCG
eukprot:GEMP01083671.1.p1 GENE.GEMP01083671.1~~GEMP01083671.1.p1  ORF type:complete len:185 (+),score=10.74 GEMP01083671.1:26-556(+)